MSFLFWSPLFSTCWSTFGMHNQKNKPVKILTKMPSSMAWMHFRLSEPERQQPGEQNKTPPLPFRAWICEKKPALVKIRQWSLICRRMNHSRAVLRQPQSYLENTKNPSLAQVQTQERPKKKKRTPRKEEAVIEALTGPSPDEKWQWRIPIKDIWNHSSYLSPPSLFLSWGPAARLFSPTLSCDRDKLRSLRSNLVTVQGSRYSSQWMKKQQLQSCLVFQFSRKDPHPTKMILKFSLTDGSIWNNGMTKTEKKSPLLSLNEGEL